MRENGCKLNVMVFGGGGVGYYAAISMWSWYLHVFVGSYVSFIHRNPQTHVSTNSTYL